MLLRFIGQVAAFALFYALVMMATFPFLVYFGKPKPWQRWVQFMMSFPVDNEKVGLFSMAGGIAVFCLNGLLWGLAVVSTFRLGWFLLHR